MTQEHKDLLLKNLCARFPYGVKVNADFIDFARIGRLVSIDANEELILSQNNGYPFDKKIEYCKPYLFPLSSITIEQEKELSKLGLSYGEYALHDDIRGLGIMVEDAYIFFEYCYKHHIDFLGLIKMGLAIDATNLNIY